MLQALTTFHQLPKALLISHTFSLSQHTATAPVYRSQPHCRLSHPPGHYEYVQTFLPITSPATRGRTTTFTTYDYTYARSAPDKLCTTAADHTDCNTFHQHRTTADQQNLPLQKLGNIATTPGHLYGPLQAALFRTSTPPQHRKMDLHCWHPPHHFSAPCRVHSSSSSFLCAARQHSHSRMHIIPPHQLYTSHTWKYLALLHTDHLRAGL